MASSVVAKHRLPITTDDVGDRDGASLLRLASSHFVGVLFVDLLLSAHVTSCFVVVVYCGLLLFNSGVLLNVNVEGIR